MYTLLVASLEKTLFEGQVSSLSAPGTLGYFQILTNHAPFAATLNPGTIRITKENKDTISFDIPGGIMEMSSNKCTVLVDLYPF